MTIQNCWLSPLIGDELMTTTTIETTSSFSSVCEQRHHQNYQATVEHHQCVELLDDHEVNDSCSYCCYLQILFHANYIQSGASEDDLIDEDMKKKKHDDD